MDKQPFNEKKSTSNHATDKKNKKKSFGFKKFFLALLTLFIVVFLGVGCGLVAIGLDGDKDVSDIHPPASSQILDMNGNLITNIHATENRTLVTLDKIPANLQNAFIAVEDNRFYEHNGIDPKGIFRAIYSNLTSGEVAEGGSTITQQLAKNAFLSQDRTFKRKIQEFFIALRLERQYTKEEILEMYLNQIYFGRGAYGVQAAAQTYFGKDVSQLDLSECAMLAGIPRSPNYYSPLNNLGAANERKAEVLDQMVKYGYIDSTTAAKTKAESLRLVNPKEQENDNTASYFIDYVTQEMIDKFGADAVYKEGLKIYVSIDMNMQKAAEQSVNSLLPTYYNDANGLTQPQGALVAIDPKTGYIKAMVGGRGTDQFNRAVLAVRQPGSAFKPFTFAAALENKMTPDTTIEDKPFKLGDWQPQNYDRTFRGTVSIRQTAINSLNIPTIRLAEKLSIDKVLLTAQNLGISTLELNSKEANDKNLAASIGGLTNGVTVLDMAGAYSAFANHGIYTKPTAIVKVVDRKGKTIYEHTPETKQVLSERTATLLTDMLEDVITKGTGKAANINRPAAGKTGTTDNYQDAWFAGYTPDLVTVVWMGCDDNDVMPGITGGTTPAKIWQNFMKTALASIPAKNFDGSDTSIDNPVQNVESNAKTTAKDVSHEKEKPSKEAPDKQKPVHNEQTNPNDAQQPIDENEPIEENIEQPSLPAPRQNLPEPSIQQCKGLN